ncbi:hypothetical protein [Sphingobacterium haloxyli]|uniref:Uncharacterized protein n=1 Tax=Sphingobacterium haloxyli TaxID=2100533 RepID=A0A2S9J034_9SPHI|nr:hypothetical protein [Sphingobacterium haloxyli]PRD46139.1 hypothetical protein C5745_17105 [Sphingobacterium haloxyli]
MQLHKMIKERINFFIIVLVSFTTISCDSYERYYEQNRNDLDQLAAVLLTQLEDEDVYCIDDSLNSLSEKMRDLGIDCVNRDTIEGTLNFIFQHRQSLSSVEFIYQYDASTGNPKSFPKAGEVVEKLSDKWFVRKIAFD